MESRANLRRERTIRAFDTDAGLAPSARPAAVRQPADGDDVDPGSVLPSEPASGPGFDALLARADGAMRTRLVMQLQQAHGNQFVQRLLRRDPTQQRASPPPSELGVIQRSPLSDELAASSQNKKPEEIFTLLSQKKFKDGALDATELGALNAVLDKVLTDPNDRWVAGKILAGQLGMSQGIARKDQPGLPADIPPQPVEVYFFPGVSDERALVVAGVHGSERQGIQVARMLIDEVLKKTQPYYTVIIVPSLFPQHAHKSWGAEGTRERSTFTNRNFPDLDQEVAEYKGGQALDAAGSPIKARADEKGRVRDILPENVMLMELIDRFQPSRIISIHGTYDSSAAGIFADPQFLSPAKEKAIDTVSAMLGWLSGVVAPVFGFEEDDQLRFDAIKKSLTDVGTKVDQSRTQNDIDLALATAYAIADQTAGAAELKGRFTDKNKKKFPSVAGNALYAGAGKENATWREDMDAKTRQPKPWQERAQKKGISLGLYGPAKGISVFTVEPPVNRALDFYDGKNKEPKESGGAAVSKAQREMELKAYAEAVATILLGPDAGAAALSKQRP